jgi:Protein of unknown function (DUF2510)/Domain of unknown function (DUF4190)
MSSYLPPSSSPGWYNDPQAPGTVRYFDGASWTQHVAPAPGAVVTAVAPVGAWVPPKPHGIGADPSDPVHWLLPTGRTWQSIAAGYVALFACVLWFLGPFALGLGIWALTESHKTGSHGRGRAIFAIVVGGLATLAMIIFVLAVSLS